MIGRIFSKDIGSCMKRIFACDIDGTIYFDDTNLIELQHVIYELSKSWIIVFNTSRSLSDFQKLKLSLCQEGYAIVDSGKSIYKFLNCGRMKLDSIWEEYCSQYEFDELAIEADLLSLYYVSNIKVVFPWYIHIDLNRNLAKHEIEFLAERCKIKDYEFSYDGNGIGKALHRFISKKNALDFISKQSGNELFLGVGNNLVDKPFVDLCRRRVMVTLNSNFYSTDYIKIKPSGDSYKEIARILENGGDYECPVSYR